MNAYDSSYVSGAQTRLGCMLDFVVNGCGLSLDGFYDQFLSSSIAVRFAAGEPAIVAGRSGKELAIDVLCDGDYQRCSQLPLSWTPSYAPTREYWTGWALAFYQWASGSTFSAIQKRASISQIRSMYTPYHEMDIRQFCDHLDSVDQQDQPRTHLQAARLAAGLSQSQLARASGVPVRTLQQYEQEQKDINHARVDYVLALARTLCCEPRDLLEYKASPSYEYAIMDLP